MYEIKLRNGKVIESINRKLEEKENQASILTFTLLQNSTYFNTLEEFITDIDVWKNEDRIFTGRVIDIKKGMDSSGIFTCEVTCESAINFLNDTRVGKWDIHPDLYIPEATTETILDPYNVYIQMTVLNLLQLILNNHNSKVLDNRKILLGTVTVNDTVYCNTDRETSLNCIQQNLINKKSGYISVRMTGGSYYLDYLATPVGLSENLIELTVNMNSITHQGAWENIYTRLIPIGKDGLKIGDINEGLDYVEDSDLVAKYGVIETVEKFDNVTIAENLKDKAIDKLEELNQNKYSIECSALDLNCIDSINFSEFKLSQSCRLLNGVIPINEVHRIIALTINLDEEWNISFKFSNESPSNIIKSVKKEQKLSEIDSFLSFLLDILFYKPSEKKVNEIANIAAQIESGTTTNRPTQNLYVGRIYFDTTLGKQINVKSISPTVWVDGNGTVV